MIAVACLSFGAWLLAWWPPTPSRRVASWLAGRGQARRPPGSSYWPILLAGLAGLGVVWVLVPAGLVWAVPAMVVSGTIGWLVVGARAEKRRHDNAAEVVQACLAVAAQLRVGDIAAVALARVAADSPLLAPVAATQVIGGDVPAALRAVAVRPGCAGLASLARSWQLCQLTGAPIAAAATRVAEGLRAEAAAERLVAAELAAPRASGRLLALLPVLGVGLGFVAGGNPVEFLLGTFGGQICLVAAISLVCAGMVWTTRLGRLRTEGEES